MKIAELKNTKAIVSSDWHINNFTEYNPTEEQLITEDNINPLGFSNINEYRLNQIIMIAYRIVWECKKHKTNLAFILGDLIHLPNCPPIVINTLKLALSIITDAGIDVYYIVGQHDNKTRKTSIDIRKDSWVGTLRNSHFKYVHGKQFKMGKQIIEFHNFNFDDNITVAKDNTTILLTHQSIGGFGQSSKGKSLKMVIAGDIHDLVDETKKNIEYHSCATPFVIYPHQNMNGYIGLLDCSNDIPHYERISSNGKIEINGLEKDFNLFDILKSKDYKENSLNKTLKDIKEKEISLDDTNTDNISKKFDIRDLSSNIEEIVKDISIENGFEDLYAELDDIEIPKQIDFNFKLKTLDIENVKSIKKLHLDFETLEGISFLSGKTGSGKSSILRSLETALKGNSRIKTLLRTGETNLLLDLTLEYRKDSYRIIRKVSKTEFYKNDIKYELGKKETEQQILEDLPFINYLNYFICHANSHFFDSVDRTQLIMDLFNLNSLDSYRESIEDLVDNIEESIKDKTIEKTTLDSQLKDYSEDKKNLKQRLDKLKSECNIIHNAREKLTEFNELNNNIKSSKKLCEEYKKDIDYYEKSLSEYSNDNTYQRALKCLKDIETYEKVRTSIKQQESKIKLAKNELDSNLSIRNNLMATPKCKCPECFHEFYLNGIEDKIKACSSEIANKEIEIKKLEQELEFVSTGLETLETEYSKEECNSIINKYNSVKTLREQLNKTKNKYAEENKKGSDNYTLKKAILESNNCSSEDEYLDLLNMSIEQSIKLKTMEEEYSNIINKINNYKIKLENIENSIKKLTKKYHKAEKYESLFDMENLDSIPYKIINKVIHSLDNKNIRFVSTKELNNGEDRFEINAEINVDGKWIDYDSSSDGQHCLLDIFILYSVLTNLKKVGVLILDESLANCDNDTVSFITSIIRIMKKYVTNTLITSHSDYFDGYDHLLGLQRINGITEIT